MEAIYAVKLLRSNGYRVEQDAASEPLRWSALTSMLHDNLECLQPKKTYLAVWQVLSLRGRQMRVKSPNRSGLHENALGTQTLRLKYVLLTAHIP